MTEDQDNLEEQAATIRDYLNMLSESGFDVVEVSDIEKKYPRFNCRSILLSLGYSVEEGMVFL